MLTVTIRVAFAAWLALSIGACSGDDDDDDDSIDAGAVDACVGATGCGGVCERGNSYGIGMFCTAGGGECADSPGRAAPFCTVDQQPGAPPFCTRPCTVDMDCAEDARCVGETEGGPKGCTPVFCLGDDDLIDAGTGDVDGGATDAGSR